jgi:hypothetical protein
MTPRLVAVLTLVSLSAACGVGKDASTCAVDGSYLVCSDNPDAPMHVGATDAGPPVVVTTEPPGSNCPTGGQKITTTDSLADGAVATSTTYVCNSAQVLPAQCVQGTDPFSGTGWVMCGTVTSDAGVQPLLSTIVTSTDSDAGLIWSTIHVDYVCEQLGFASADVVNWNCDNTCDTEFPGGSTYKCSSATMTCSSFQTPIVPMFNYYGHDTHTLVDGGPAYPDMPADAHGRYVDDGTGDYAAVWTCK